MQCLFMLCAVTGSKQQIERGDPTATGSDVLVGMQSRGEAGPPFAVQAIQEAIHSKVTTIGKSVVIHT